MKKNLTPRSGFFSRQNQFSGLSSQFTRKSISLFLLAVFSFPLMAGEGKSDLQAPWAGKASLREMENKRSRTAKHFTNSDGKSTAFLASGSIHYQDANNAWKEINNTIVANQSVIHPYKSVENTVKTYFPANPFKNSVIMMTREGAFQEKVSAIRFEDAAGNTLSSVSLSGNISVSIDHNKITYSGFHPFLSLVYSLGNDSRKFNLVISSPSFLASLPKGTSKIVIAEEMMCDNREAVIKKTETGLVYEANGVEVLGFSQPVAFDSNHQDDAHTEGQMRISEKGNISTLETVFDAQWLQSPARVFPLMLDPTVNYYPQLGSMWTGRFTTSTTKTSGYLRLTAGTTAAWAKFDLATLPAGASVNAATYYGYHYSTTSTDKYVDIRGLSSVDPVPATAAALWNECTTGTVYNNNYTFGGSTYQWRAGLLGGTALADIASAAGTWIGLGFSYSSGSTTFMYHYGTNGTSSQICYLEVTYFTTPCAGTPDGNSVVTPTFELCPTSTVALTLANTYTVANLTYQWSWSTTSAVGLYTAIPNATAAAFTTPSVGVTSWYQVVITCPNQGTTMAVGAITVAATTTSVVPYKEDFELVGVNDRLPNCSWLATGMLSSTRTYTSAQSGNRIPNSGSSFAAFTNDPGTHYYYTNGIWMEPGITYSASLWFTTDFSGSTNWSNLGILLGTAQSAAALQPIVEINGPAVSPTYKPLSNTFTVSAPAFYYVAVRATAAAGGAEYLSWDDLEITIPCEAGANTPTLSLSASSGTICRGTPVTITASGSGNVSWDNGSTGLVLSDVPYNTTTYVATGTNTLTGCFTNASVVVKVNPSPAVGLIANPVVVCMGKPVTLMASGASSYAWSTGGVGAVITAVPTGNTTYSVIGTGTNNCTGQSSILVTVLPLPTVIASGSGQSICQGDQLMLNASGAVTYEWISDISANVHQGSPIFVQPVSSGAYTVTGTDNMGCENTAVVSVVVDPCTGLDGHVKSGLTRIFPNPSAGVFRIESFGNVQDILITDLTGRVVYQQEMQGRSGSFDIGHLAAGVYYVKLGLAHSSETFRVIRD